MTAVERCRTAALGGHVEQCADCGHRRIAYNSCRNRHCPQCQAAAARAWLEARRADLLPIGYFHVVFTLPAEIGAVAYTNKAVVYDLLFRTAADTLLTIAADPKHLGVRRHLLRVERAMETSEERDAGGKDGLLVILEVIRLAAAAEEIAPGSVCRRGAESDQRADPVELCGGRCRAVERRDRGAGGRGAESRDEAGDAADRRGTAELGDDGVGEPYRVPRRRCRLVPTPPGRCPPGRRSSGLRPRPAGRDRWARGGVDGCTSRPTRGWPIRPPRASARARDGG